MEHNPRTQAERFNWRTSAERMIAIHEQVAREVGSPGATTP